MADDRATLPRAGSVYVMFNEREPYLVKVGRTTKTPEQRARDLRTTGVPGRFIVAYDVYVNDAPAVETAVHDALAESRYVKDREFFTCGPKHAIDAVLRAARGRTMVSPWADSEVEMLTQIVARYSSVLKASVTSIAMTVQADAVVLRCSFKEWDNEVSIIETNLGFIGSDDEPMFSPASSARDNAEIFLTLDALDLAHCTPLIKDGVDEAALRALG